MTKKNDPKSAHKDWPVATKNEIEQAYDHLLRTGGPKDPEDYRNLSPKQTTKELTQDELDAVKKFIGNPPKPGGPS